MFRSILIGLDGSPWSAAAVAVGTRLARRSGAEVVGIGVVDTPTICKAEPVGIGGGSFKRHRDEALLAEARTRVHAFVTDFLESCAAQGVAARAVEAEGVPNQCILELADDLDVTVLGRQTHYHFATQAGPCETLHKVLRNSPRPVLAVPRDVPEVDCVLVAYDASPAAVRALRAFQVSGLDEGKPVHVVSVARNHATAVKQAEEAAGFLRFYGLQAQAHPVESTGRADDALLAEAVARHAGLIVLGAYGKSSVADFVFGSATRTVLDRSDALLLLHH
jgi:nucleotide-binding universal stress UspA family protein